MRLLTPNWNNQNYLGRNLFDQMDRFFSDLPLVASVELYDERRFDPAVEIAESDDQYLVSFDIPGMKKEDIKIEIDQNMLVISGERKRETNADKKNKLQRFEKSYGYFKRIFTLPQGVDCKNVEAHYENGVLDLTLPKTAEAKPRQIEIQSGKPGFMEKLMGSKKTPQIEKSNAS